MGVFNDNIRAWRQIEGLSQEKFAEKLGIKRGKLTGWEDSTEPKLDFFAELVEKYNLNLSLFLTELMTESNYLQFFTTDETIESSSLEENNATEIQLGDFSKKDFYDLMLLIREESNGSNRSKLIEKAIQMVNILEDEKTRIQRDLFDLVQEVRLLYKKRSS